MPNSYIVMGLLAVAGIILSLIWVKSSTLKSKQIDDNESIKWARKWNEQWCDSNCNDCGENDNCKFSEVAK